MTKLGCAAVLGALAISVAVPTTASAVAVVHPVLVETSSTAGAAATGVFIGFVAAFDIYDIIRRATCSGDFLALGGPGFTSPTTPGMNVMILRCPVVHKHRHHNH